MATRITEKHKNNEQNLIPNVGNRNGGGRPAGLKTRAKSLPPDARVRLEQVLWNVLQRKNIAEAKQYLEANAENLGEFGLIVQILQRGLLGDRGVQTFWEIYEHLFGRPKQAVDVDAQGAAIILNITTGDPAGLQQVIESEEI